MSFQLAIPNSSTMAQRVVQYQAVLQMAQSAPQIYDLPQLHRQMIEVLGVKNADKLVPTTDDIRPTDPVSENMNALNGKPMKAFIYQDHEAHMAAHQSFLKDPMVAATIGQNPQAQRIAAALQAHIAEHLGFKYRKDMEEKIGAPYQTRTPSYRRTWRFNLARLMAQAGQQLTQQNQQRQAQQQAQQKAQDPVVQMQQAELQIKQQEVQRKAAKDQADAQIEQAKLQLQAQENMQDAQMDQAELAMKQQELQIDAQKGRCKTCRRSSKDNTKLDLDLLKTMKDSNNNRGQ